MDNENLEEEDLLLNQMIEDLKKQKFQHQQNQIVVSGSPTKSSRQYSTNYSFQNRNGMTPTGSHNKLPYQQNSQMKKGQDDFDMNDKLMNSLKYKRQKGQMSAIENYDELKKQKLDEVRQELLKESSIQDDDDEKLSSMKKQKRDFHTELASSSSTYQHEKFDKRLLQESPKLKERDTSANRKFPKYRPNTSTHIDQKSPQRSLNAKETKMSNNGSAIRNNKRQDTSQTRARQDISQTRMRQDTSQSRSQQDNSKMGRRKNSNTSISNASTKQAQASEKSQQIYFKKLQKDVEMAIRAADMSDKGGLDLEEFKQCLFNMNYLPFMQSKSQSSQNTRGYDYTYQNTVRSLIIQEKEFVFNIWQILNPNNKFSIENAVIYDVLLLLIYNVSSPVTVTTNFLTEYINNLYKEENLDIDGWLKFNCEINEAQKLNLEGQSLLNQYLLMNNIWMVEKLAQEFKIIHANRVSSIQNGQRSRSPSINSNNKGRGVSPDDCRKYKKNTVKDHYQQCTFSPLLSKRTQQIDQQLTQKIANDMSHKRDTSADALMSRNEEQQNYLSEKDPNSLSSLKRYELLFYRHHMAEQKIEQAKENLMKEKFDGFTFKPKIHQNPSNYSLKTQSRLNKQANEIFNDLQSKIQLSKERFETREDKEIQECTFKPQINNNSYKQGYKSKQNPDLPRGYNKEIDRIRRVNEEKKNKELALQKMVTGENYERMKLQSVKPPSFVEADRKKRKLLMYVDVNITPTKTGRIGIYEGDDVRELAKNFQKAFQLNNAMLHMLTMQLEQHLQGFKQRMEQQQQHMSVPSQVYAAGEMHEVFEQMSEEDQSSIIESRTDNYSARRQQNFIGNLHSIDMRLYKDIETENGSPS